MRPLRSWPHSSRSCSVRVRARFPGFLLLSYDVFLPIMMRAVARGYVRQEHVARHSAYPSASMPKSTVAFLLESGSTLLRVRSAPGWCIVRRAAASGGRDRAPSSVSSR